MVPTGKTTISTTRQNPTPFFSFFNSLSFIIYINSFFILFYLSISNTFLSWAFPFRCFSIVLSFFFFSISFLILPLFSFSSYHHFLSLLFLNVHFLPVFTHFHHYFPSLPTTITSFHCFFLITIFFLYPPPAFFLSCTLLPLSLLFSLFSSIHSHYSFFPFYLHLSALIFFCLFFSSHTYFLFLSFHIHIHVPTPCSKQFCLQQKSFGIQINFRNINIADLKRQKQKWNNSFVFPIPISYLVSPVNPHTNIPQTLWRVALLFLPLIMTLSQE